MDERLEKALDFANYRITLGNQQRTLKQRIRVLQTVHYNKGVFFADSQTISFVKALIDCDKKESVIIDSKENPIVIDDLKDFLDTLLSAYNESMNEYKVQSDKIKKSRNIKSLMDW
tara:strand:+ start:24126 stop:24473 length:348 start_codon:yes stop_codon:yes gene_type:complete